MHAMRCEAVLGAHVWCVVFGDVVMIQFLPPPVSGACGAGKSFTADQLLVKMFQTAHRTDWLQDLRKVRHSSPFLLPFPLSFLLFFPLPTFLSPSLPLFFLLLPLLSHTPLTASPSHTQYWQVSSVVLKALGTACTESNKDSSRIVSQEALNLESFNNETMATPAGKIGGYLVQWVADCQSKNKLLLPGPSELHLEL